STMLLASFDWRAIFVFGAVCTGVMLIVVWVALPESIEYLATRRPPNYLDRINKTLARMGHGTIARLPDVVATVQKNSMAALLSPEYRVVTMLLTVAYFAHIMTFYYI